MKRQHTDSHKDITHLSHPISKKHAQMSIRNRTAQSAPFVALTGHKEAIQKAQRLVDQRKVLDGSRNMQGGESLQEILQHITGQPRIWVTYFQPDEREDGGAYRTPITNLKKMDGHNHGLVFSDHSQIPLDDIYEIELLLKGWQGQQRRDVSVRVSPYERAYGDGKEERRSCACLSVVLQGLLQFCRIGYYLSYIFYNKLSRIMQEMKQSLRLRYNERNDICSEVQNGLHTFPFDESALYMGKRGMDAYGYSRMFMQ